MCFSRWKLDMERSYQIHEKQTTKNIGLLFWSKQYPSIKCLLSLYYSLFMPTYLTLGGVAIYQTWKNQYSAETCN